MDRDAVPMSQEVWRHSLPVYLFWANQRAYEHDVWWAEFLRQDKRNQRTKGPAS